MRRVLIQVYLYLRFPPDDRGQTTAEYALVLLAAATLALLLVAWAAQSGKIGELFDKVFDEVIGKVT
jgi:Flp pilus assembly pilin Flp